MAAKMLQILNWHHKNIPTNSYNYLHIIYNYDHCTDFIAIKLSMKQWKAGKVMEKQ